MNCPDFWRTLAGKGRIEDFTNAELASIVVHVKTCTSCAEIVEAEGMRELARRKEPEEFFRQMAQLTAAREKLATKTYDPEL